MKPESFDDELRSALQPSALEIASLRTSALTGTPRKRLARRPVLIGLLALLAIAAGWWAIPSAVTEPIARRSNSWTTRNHGDVVSARRGEQTWILGSAVPRQPKETKRRLWISVADRDRS